MRQVKRPDAPIGQGSLSTEIEAFRDAGPRRVYYLRQHQFRRIRSGRLGTISMRRTSSADRRLCKKVNQKTVAVAFPGQTILILDRQTIKTFQYFLSKQTSAFSSPATIDSIIKYLRVPDTARGRATLENESVNRVQICKKPAAEVSECGSQVSTGSRLN